MGHLIMHINNKVRGQGHMCRFLVNAIELAGALYLRLEEIVRDT